ncbi:uncharacterized protein PHACADRAFT_259874, partial [Phanerochaete carnosa HHB-10118-sp]
MEALHLESLLLEYFSADTRRCAESYDDLLMFVLTSREWLKVVELDDSSNETPNRVLEKNVAIANVILGPERGMISAAAGEDIAHWANAVRYKPHGLSKYCGPMFRRLLHIFEQAFRNGILAGDQDELRKTLHSTLSVAHEGSVKCENPHCQWSLHRCGGSWKSRFQECPLLEHARIEGVSRGCMGGVSNAAYADSLEALPDPSHLSILEQSLQRPAIPRSAAATTDSEKLI